MARLILSENEIIERCSNLGFKLDSIKKFDKSNSILNIKCESCKYIYETKFSYLKYRTDKRCDECRRKSMIRFDTGIYIKHGYSVLSEYVNNKEPLKLKHLETGIEFYYTHSDFLKVKHKNNIFKSNKKDYIEKIIYKKEGISDVNGAVKFPCPVCKSIISRPYYKSIELFKNINYDVNICCLCNTKNKAETKNLIFLQNEGIKVLGDFEHSKKPILIECNECGVSFSRSIFSLKQGASKSCKSCSNTGTSKEEEELVDFINSLNVDFIKNYRIKNIELDIYIPEYNLGIEYNGYYWHSCKFKPKNYHIDKTNFFKSHNIDVLHFYDLEWNNKKEIVKSILKSKLNKNDRIYARHCKIKEISTEEKDNFLNNTHLQGTDRSKVRLGLFHNDKLISVMTFLKSRFDSKYEWELSRFSSSNGVSVIGGASKLFSYFNKIYNPKTIVSYANKRISNGNLYFKLNFDLIGDTPLGYNYFKGKQMFSRIPFQKHKLKNKLETFDPNLTEYENMENHNFYRCWDCGNFKFEFKNK